MTILTHFHTDVTTNEKLTKWTAYKTNDVK